MSSSAPNDGSGANDRKKSHLSFKELGKTAKKMLPRGKKPRFESQNQQLTLAGSSASAGTPMPVAQSTDMVLFTEASPDSGPSATALNTPAPSNATSTGSTTSAVVSTVTSLFRHVSFLANNSLGIA